MTSPEWTQARARRLPVRLLLLPKNLRGLHTYLADFDFPVRWYGLVLMALSGWTPRLVDQVATGATEWMLAQRTWLSGDVFRDGTESVERARDYIWGHTVLHLYMWPLVPVRRATDWITALSASPPTAGWSTPNPDVATLVMPWVPVGKMGPWAWAAGLSITEATRMKTEETLDEPTLLTLAGLRGFRFP